MILKLKTETYSIKIHNWVIGLLDHTWHNSALFDIVLNDLSVQDFQLERSDNRKIVFSYLAEVKVSVSTTGRIAFRANNRRHGRFP